MRSIAVALAVARKDLVSEWRSRELVPALAQFVVLALVIANFGFQIDSSNAPAIAPGVLWLALVFAGLVAFGRAFAAEKEQSSLEQVILTSAPPAAIFAGKALAAAALLVVCEAVLLPALALFFGTPLSIPLAAAVLLATIGMAALGCIGGRNPVADVCLYCHVRKQGQVLEHIPDPTQLARKVNAGRAIEKQGLGGKDSASVRICDSGDAIQNCAFAGP